MAMFKTATSGQHFVLAVVPVPAMPPAVRMDPAALQAHIAQWLGPRVRRSRPAAMILPETSWLPACAAAAASLGIEARVAIWITPPPAEGPAEWVEWLNSLGAVEHGTRFWKRLLLATTDPLTDQVIQNLWNIKNQDDMPLPSRSPAADDPALPLVVRQAHALMVAAHGTDGAAIRPALRRIWANLA